MSKLSLDTQLRAETEFRHENPRQVGNTHRHAGGEGIFRQGEGHLGAVADPLSEVHGKGSGLAIGGGGVAGGAAKK